MSEFDIDDLSKKYNAMADALRELWSAMVGALEPLVEALNNFVERSKDNGD